MIKSATKGGKSKGENETNIKEKGKINFTF